MQTQSEIMRRLRAKLRRVVGDGTASQRRAVLAAASACRGRSMKIVHSLFHIVNGKTDSAGAPALDGSTQNRSLPLWNSDGADRHRGLVATDAADALDQSHELVAHGLVVERGERPANPQIDRIGH